MVSNILFQTKKEGKNNCHTLSIEQSSMESDPAGWIAAFFTGTDGFMVVDDKELPHPLCSLFPLHYYSLIVHAIIGRFFGPDYLDL